MHLLTVDVTAKDIVNGQRKNTRECPIACAMLRALAGLGEPNRYEVAIGEDSFGIFDKREHQVYEFKTPLHATTFIRMFDAGANPDPFRFQFDMTSGKKSGRGLGSFGGNHLAEMYLIGSWYMDDFPTYPKAKFTGFKIPLEYKPLNYVKITSLDIDIKEVKEVKEPTTEELMEFINKSELSFDHALVKI